MTKIVKLKTSDVNECIWQIEDIKYKLECLDEELKQYVKNNYNEVYKYIKQNPLTNNNERLKKIQDYLRNTNDTFNNVESYLCLMDPLKYDGSVPFVTGDNISTVTDELGFFGKFYSVWNSNKEFEENINLKNFLGVGKSLTSIVGTGIEWSESVVKNKSFLFLDKIGADDLSDITKKTGFDVFGDVLGIGMRTLDNIEEHDGDVGSVVLETAVETVVDIGIDAGLKYGAAALGVAVFGTAGAPALLIGAGVAGAKIGIDWVCESVCGKDSTELVSDLLIDIGGGAIEFAKDAGDVIGDCFDGIASWASDIF